MMEIEFYRIKMILSLLFSLTIIQYWIHFFPFTFVLNACYVVLKEQIHCAHIALIVFMRCISPKLMKYNDSTLMAYLNVSFS